MGPSSLLKTRDFDSGRHARTFLNGLLEGCGRLMPGLGLGMGQADRAVPSSESWRPWPVFSRAEALFLLGERSAAERIAQRLFRRPLEMWEYAGLAGAPDDARVEVGASRKTLYIEMGDPVNATYRAYYYLRRTCGQLVLINDGFHIRALDRQRRGFGLKVFHRQVQNALRLGIVCINTVAGRGHGENGYYTWPRFGFNGGLPTRVRRRLPDNLHGRRTVLDLMDCRRGRDWWREHGETLRVTFNLVAGSRSRAMLSRYVFAKMKIASGPKTNLENHRAMSYGNAR